MRLFKIQYGDYAHWQRQQAQRPEYGAQLAYWKDRLQGVPPLLELPTDYPRPKRIGTVGRRHTFSISSALMSRLYTLARSNGATLFMTLLAAFDVLLSRYARQSDIVVGSPISGRTHPELEPLIGCFLNMLVLRVNVSHSLTFIELLALVRSVVLDAFLNQSVAFEQLVEHPRPERNLGSAPLFQVMFVLQNFIASTEDPEGLRITPLLFDTDTAKLDLSLIFEERTDELRGIIEYRADLFEHATIVRMAAQVTRLLEQVVSNPSAQIAQLSLISPSEYHEIIIGWNATDTLWAEVDCLPRLFEAQVRRNPEKIAVCAGGTQLTYDELNRRANSLAHRLRGAGVGPDVLVPVYLRRSVELAIALLAVAKSGGAYIPVDVRTPQVRLQKILSDAQSRIILTEQSLTTALPLESDHWVLGVGLQKSQRSILHGRLKVVTLRT